MGLKKFAQEDVKEVSMIELAYELLEDKNQSISFKDLYEEISKEKDFSDDVKTEYISQLYTDLNIDGRFIAVGPNVWGLKQWYPFDKTEEDIISLEEVGKEPKKRKKKKSSTDTIKDGREEDTMKEDFKDVDAGFSEEDDVNLFGQMEEEREDDDELIDDAESDDNEEKDR